MCIEQAEEDLLFTAAPISTTNTTTATAADFPSTASETKLTQTAAQQQHYTQIEKKKTATLPHTEFFLL